jgi:hypothetical protein
VNFEAAILALRVVLHQPRLPNIIALSLDALVIGTAVAAGYHLAKTFSNALSSSFFAYLRF